MLEKRIEELEYEVQKLKGLLISFEYATAELIEERIKQATYDFITMEEVEVAFDL